MATAAKSGRTNGKRAKAPRFLKHRNLVAGEALALAGVAKFELTLAVKHYPDLPNAVKVLFLIAATVGIFGVLFLGLERLLARSVERTHSVMKVLPLPMPVVLFHVSAWVGIFYLYAWVYALPVIPMAIDQ